MITTSKYRLGWAGLALLMFFTALSVPPAQGASPWCNLSDCDAFCAEACCGHAATCQWNEFSGSCRGICWCGC